MLRVWQPSFIYLTLIYLCKIHLHFDVMFWPSARRRAFLHVTQQPWTARTDAHAHKWQDAIIFQKSDFYYKKTYTK